LKLNVKTAVLLILFLMVITSCGQSEKSRYSENRLVEIYARVELGNIEKASEVVKQYELDNEQKREAYYNALQELATNREKWEEFLKKVEEYRREHELKKGK
jgi:hypothetical protein